MQAFEAPKGLSMWENGRVWWVVVQHGNVEVLSSKGLDSKVKMSEGHHKLSEH